MFGTGERNAWAILMDANDVISREASLKSDIERVGGERVAEGVERVRRGDIVIEPGYDCLCSGVFGKVSVWREDETYIDKQDRRDGQGVLFAID